MDLADEQDTLELFLYKSCIHTNTKRNEADNLIKKYHGFQQMADLRDLFE